MIKVVYIILSLNLLISSSHGSGVLKNIIIPGWGFEQLENHQNKSKRYFLTEASICIYILELFF